MASLAGVWCGAFGLRRASEVLDVNSRDDPLMLHRQALVLADQAYIACRNGQVEASVELARKALEYEIEAAKRLPPVAGSEPTRSVLYLAAASLAWQAKDYELALELTAQGRTSWTPAEVLAEFDTLERNVRLALQTRMAKWGS